MFEAALERVRTKLDPKAYQIFDLYVLKEQSARSVARTLGIGVARVYLAKHRVQAALSREVQRLENQIRARVRTRAPNRPLPSAESFRYSPACFIAPDARR